MIDKWFLNNIEKQLAYRQRVVVLDPTGSFDFLIKLAEEKGLTVLRTDGSLTEEWQRVKEELFLRYEAEKNHKDENVVFYATREKEKLSFLFDYCFTHGCVDFSKPTEWLRKWLFEETGLQITLDDNLLLTAAKLSIGKSLDWWKKILQNLEDLISIDEEMIPFLSDPENYFKDKEPDVKRLFEEKLFELLGQPYSEKPPKTLAKEVVNLIFAESLNNDIQPQLLNIYRKWLDSNIYSQSLKRYIENYNPDASVNIWNVHPDHCFPQIDRKQLEEITLNFRNRKFVEEKLQKIKNRVKSKYAKRFIPSWWNDLITLVEFKTDKLNSCGNLQKVVEFYTASFQKVDRAIRNLYVHFINKEKIIRPIQEYYESLNSEMLQRWFDYIDEYKPNQSGYLVDLFKSANPKTAVIVGDGIRYEIADYVAGELSNLFEIDKSVMLADIPSETEHNMSALYMWKGEIAKLQKDREKKLPGLTEKPIAFKNLEQINYSEDSDYLVLTYKDIDSAGEKLQLGALKLFSEFENVLIEKIQLLIKKGYNVHLITDHGFVLTGLLDEADKIEANVTGKAKIHERYIRTVEKQNCSDWLQFEKKYGEMNYVYVAKNHRPFKSVGVYGFAHGGLTPQEVVIPNFVFQKQQQVVAGLKVEIINKEILAEVTGENFGIKIKAMGDSSDLLSSVREIQILLYAENINYSSSNIIKVMADKAESFEFSFNKKNKVKAVLIDARTKEQLDFAEINKSTVRDLDGLL